MNGFVLEFGGDDNGESFHVTCDTKNGGKVSLWYGSLSETEYASWSELALSFPGIIRELLKYGILKETEE